MFQICTIDFFSASNICYCKDMLFNNFDMFNTSSSYEMLVQDLNEALLLYRIASTYGITYLRCFCITASLVTAC